MPAKELEIGDIIVGDLTVRGNWVVGGVQSSVPWPLSVTKLTFEEMTIFLAPQTKITRPFVAVNLPNGAEFKEGQKIISHFLSALSWMEGQGIAVDHWTGGSRPIPTGRGNLANVVTEKIELENLQTVTDERTRWALAFYREGMSLNNIAYATLSLFKIINIFANSGPKQKAWINANLGNLRGSRYQIFEAGRRVSELKSGGVTDIGEYLYASGRCAVAHAGVNPTVDPENPDDIQRLTKDLPVIQALAAHAIEVEFGLKSATTIWREHLYELAGFKELIGTEIANRLKHKEHVRPDELQILQRIHIRISDKGPYDALNNMSLTVECIDNGCVNFVCISEGGTISLSLTLNFPEERMIFELDNRFTAKDDGTASAARMMASAYQFIWDYLGNGKLHVYDAASSKLLGRKDAYIPTNIDFGSTGDDYKILIAQSLEEAERRSQR